MIYLDAPKGLGNAIYLRAVVLHFLNRGDEVTVFTPWPDVFIDLPVIVRPRAESTRYSDLRRVASSPMKSTSEDQTWFDLCCLEAGITEPVDLRMDWTVRNTGLVKRIKREAAGRKIFVYQPLKVPHNQEQELQRPRREAFNRFVNQHSEHFRIKLGHPPFVQDDKDLQCEMDLCGKAFICDSFDVIAVGDLFFGEGCFVTHMAEVMNKPFTTMFARAQFNSDSLLLRRLTPDRQIHNKQFATVIYDDV